MHQDAASNEHFSFCSPQSVTLNFSFHCRLKHSETKHKTNEHGCAPTKLKQKVARCGPWTLDADSHSRVTWRSLDKGYLIPFVLTEANEPILMSCQVQMMKIPLQAYWPLVQHSEFFSALSLLPMLSPVLPDPLHLLVYLTA